MGEGRAGSIAAAVIRLITALCFDNAMSREKGGIRAGFVASLPLIADVAGCIGPDQWHARFPRGPGLDYRR